jgi:hypothetical protein
MKGGFHGGWTRIKANKIRVFLVTTSGLVEFLSKPEERAGRLLGRHRLALAGARIKRRRKEWAIGS